MLEILISSTVLILALTALRFFLRGKLNPRLQYALWLLAALRLLLPERRSGRARRRAAADCSGKSPCPADGQYAIPGADRIRAGSCARKSADTADRQHDFETRLADWRGSDGAGRSGAESAVSPETEKNPAAVCLPGKPGSGLGGVRAAVAVPCGAVPPRNISHTRGCGGA